MQKKYGGIKIIVVLAIVGLFVWFLVISPMLTFRHNEQVLEDAARRYYELNPDKLPTGERVKTLSLNTLYKQSYLKEDFKVPNSKKLCSLEKSWVKVRRENGAYRYYVYLDCGLITSQVDHKGPQIKLNGKEEMTVNYGEKYKEPGVSSVVDDKDGKLDPKDVTIKGEVDTNKVGSYEITYSISDGFGNKTTVTRTVNVIKVLSGIVKNDLKEIKNYVGDASNNYVRLSYMYFRIFGLDEKDNVILVAEEDVDNVNFTKIEKWLDEVYIPSFTEEAKKMLVESKFCNMRIDKQDLNTTQCTSYTDKRYAYIPSVIDVNRAQGNGFNYMKPRTISWVGNSESDNKAYVTRVSFFYNQAGKDFLSYSVNSNYGIRPKIVIRGDALVTDGDGSLENPYVFGETKKAKGGTLLNERYIGEYVVIGGTPWRIIDTLEDGTTKVISVETIGNRQDKPQTYSNPNSATFIYDPKDKENYGYYINNKASQYIDTSYFVAHEVKAPVYSGKITYGEEKKTNTYKVKLSPPNMYDMFSAQTLVRYGDMQSYWVINSSTSKKRVGGAITNLGTPINETPFPNYTTAGVRAVAYIKKGTVISNGSGTADSPYKLK
ncbi:MAG: DUF5011 domain-containing protein [Bacilli bacterium]|nr:DUF5011 domain-containing protein [Bacilli bacterium]